MKRNKAQMMRGIALISLVIVIIVVLILASTIIAIISKNGLIESAIIAKADTALVNAIELTNLIVADVIMENHNPANDDTRNIQEKIKSALIDNIGEINKIKDITANVLKNKIWITFAMGSSGEKTFIGTIEENGTLLWEEGFAICRINKILYPDLQEAINDAIDGDVIEVTRDINLNNGIEIYNSNPFNLTIDFKNHKLTSSSTAFFLKSGNKCALTVKNAEINNSSGYGAFNNISSTLENNAPSLILIDCNITSKGEGTVWNNSGAHSMIVSGVYTHPGILIENRRGLITIQDGKFIGASISNRNNTKMIINGGDFTQTNAFVGMDGALAKNTVTIFGGTYKVNLAECVAEGYTMVENGDGYYEVIPNS